MKELPYGLSIELELPLEQAIAATKEALKGEGFGVLTEIDVQKTLKEKIAADFQPYVILGACNPSLAFVALQRVEGRGPAGAPEAGARAGGA